MLLLDGGVGFTAGDGLELSEKQQISPPPLFHAAGCCWVTATPHHRTLENHFLENINQEAECVLCDLIRQEERPEDTITRACNQEPS